MVMNVSKILLPFGTASTSMLILNVIMYCIVIFLVVFLPVYFLVIKSSSNSGNVVLTKEQMIENLNNQIATIQANLDILERKQNRTISENNQIASLSEQRFQLSSERNLLMAQKVIP